jgi:hypothetical protein
MQPARTAARTKTMNAVFKGFSNQAGRLKNGAVSNTAGAKPWPLSARLR